MRGSAAGELRAGSAVCQLWTDVVHSVCISKKQQQQ